MRPDTYLAWPSRLGDRLTVTLVRLRFMVRPDGRVADELRPITITRQWQRYAEGSALIEFGETKVLCAASVVQGVPRWRKGSGLGLSLIHI